MPEQQTRRVTQTLTVHCVDPSGIFRQLPAEFSFDSADPYAVWISVPHGDEVARWALCRSLVSRGLTDPVGEGAVQLWPSTNEAGTGVVVLDLRSPDAEVVAEVSTRELYRFLTRTLAMVPFGSERRHLDVDRLISELLDGSLPE